MVAERKPKIFRLVLILQYRCNTLINSPFSKMALAERGLETESIKKFDMADTAFEKEKIFLILLVGDECFGD